MKKKLLGRKKTLKTPRNPKKLNWAAAIQNYLKKNSRSALAENIESLSQKIGAHRSYLFNVLAGRIKDPASDKLFKISDALGVSFLELTQQALEGGPLKPFHATFNQIPILDFSQHGFKIQVITQSHSSFRDFFLGVMRIQPHREIKKWQFKKDSSVCLFVDAGTLEITVGTGTWRVLPNEAFSFDGSFPHKIKNVTSHTSKIFVVTRPPLF